MADYIASELEIDEKNSWGTDPAIFAALNEEFNFSLDAAASDKNHKCDYYYTANDDAIRINWHRDITLNYGCDDVVPPNYNVWVNPPYGRGLIQKFMEKAVEQKALGVTTVMLVPATLDAQWLPLHDIAEIRIVTGGRLSFMHPVNFKKIAGNTKGSMFVIFAPTKSPMITRYVYRDELVEKGQQILKIKGVM